MPPDTLPVSTLLADSTSISPRSSAPAQSARQRAAAWRLRASARQLRWTAELTRVQLASTHACMDMAIHALTCSHVALELELERDAERRAAQRREALG